jgi:hypothetical protein
MTIRPPRSAVHQFYIEYYSLKPRPTFYVILKIHKGIVYDYRKGRRPGTVFLAN